MIIGIDARPLEERPTGIGVYTREILRYFPTEDIKVILYSNKDIVSDLPFERRSERISGPLWRNIVLPRQLVKDKVDVYWSPIGTLPLANIPTRKVITIHDLLWIDFPETLTPRDRLGRRLQMKRSIKSADSIIVVSRFTRDRLLDNYAIDSERVHTITESTRYPTIRPESHSRRSKNILCFGGSEPRKNVNFLIRAFEQSKLPAYGWELRIVGDGANNLQHLTNSIRTLEYVSDATLTQLYSEAGAVCFPSLYEGFGLPVLEAMSLSAPLLVSDIPAFREFGLPVEATFDPISESSCAACMENLLESDVINRLLDAQKGIIRSWPSWNVVSGNTLKVLVGNKSMTMQGCLS